MASIGVMLFMAGVSLFGLSVLAGGGDNSGSDTGMILLGGMGLIASGIVCIAFLKV